MCGSKMDALRRRQCGDGARRSEPGWKTPRSGFSSSSFSSSSSIYQGLSRTRTRRRTRTMVQSNICYTGSEACFNVYGDAAQEISGLFLFRKLKRRERRAPLAPGTHHPFSRFAMESRSPSPRPSARGEGRGEGGCPTNVSSPSTSAFLRRRLRL
jgi:hypothetical protein